MGLLTRVVMPGLQIPTTGETAVDLRAKLVKDQISKQVGQPQPDGSANDASLSSTETNKKPQPN